MKGIKLILMVLVVSILVALVSAQWEEEIESLDKDEGDFSPLNSSPETPRTHLPPWFSSTPETPFTPETPLIPPGNTNQPPQIGCEDKCTLQCSKVMLVTNICLRLCKMNCLLVHSELLCDCTNNCAQSMPASLMSDPKETESYANSCYKNCMKNID